MARRTRSNPNLFAGTQTDDSVAPDPVAGELGDDFAGLGDTPEPEPDPFGDLNDSSPQVENGLETMTNDLHNGSTPMSPTVLLELKQQVSQVLLSLGLTASKADVQIFHDFATARGQYFEQKLADVIKQQENTYKLLSTLPASLSDAMAKWFETSLTRFQEAALASGVVQSGATPPVAAAPAAEKPKKEPKSSPNGATTVNPVHANILAAVLPKCREAKAKNPNFRLSYQTKGPAVWQAMVNIAATAGITVDAATVEAAFKESGRLGVDDIALG